MGLFSRKNKESDEDKVGRIVPQDGNLEGISVHKTREGKVVTVMFTTSRYGPDSTLSDAQEKKIKDAVKADRIIVKHRHWYD